MKLSEFLRVNYVGYKRLTVVIELMGSDIDERI